RRTRSARSIPRFPRRPTSSSWTSRRRSRAARVDGSRRRPGQCRSMASRSSDSLRTTAVPAHEGFFVSGFLGETVRDVARQPVGKVKDFAVATGIRSPFPKITGLLMRDRFDTFVLPWEDVAIFQRGTVRTRHVREDLLHRPPREDEIFLARHLLDKQIVDINGVKVVRVNDLK